MSTPFDDIVGGPDNEPQVEIRRSLTNRGNSGNYGSAPVDSTPGINLPPATADYPTDSVNSVNQENGGVIGVTPGGGGKKNDRAPLLQAELLRSLSNAPVGFESNQRINGLSTFSGVFCPVALSMFSVLLFLRMGFVVGQSGVFLTIGMLCLAYAIITLTVLSLAAVSTNGAIEGGGVYYMISRALGPEFGGSVGVLFFLANIFACALYISGFVEALTGNFVAGGYSIPDDADGILDGRWWRFLYGVLCSCIMLIICLVGAALFAKFALVVLGTVGVVYITVVLSLIIKNYVMAIDLPKENVRAHTCLDNGTSITCPAEANYTGIRGYTFNENLYPNFTTDYTTGSTTNFSIVFAVVFSGVTGIMAGANMSGDLKRPNVSIPNGTLQAVGATFLIYVVTTFLLGSSCSRQLLTNDYIVMQQINVWGPFIVVGIFATTIFAGMSNLIGASRVLLRLAEDKLFGVFLMPCARTARGGNPVVAVLVSWALSVLLLLIGALNTIAQITSIFFLLSYAGVNMACLALELASAPNFRPTFPYFSWHTAMLGSVVCLGMMFIISPTNSGIAIIFLLLLLMGLHYKSPAASWGSISQALIFHQVRKYLLLLDSRKDHVKYWRPQILLLVNSPKTSCPLIDFVNDLKKSGLYVLGHVKQGTLDDGQMDPLQEDIPYWLSLVDYLRVKAFVELTVARNVREGIQQLIRISGLGAMKPNTVIIGFKDGAKPENTLEQGRMLKNVKYAKLDRTEVVEYFTGSDENNWQTGSTTGTHRHVDMITYVHILNDVLKMHKNICIARHFHRLDKDMLMKAPGPRYVDVWPLNLERPHNASWGWDNSDLFLLQLACILSMVQGWKSNTTLRVFLCVNSLQDMQIREKQLKNMLNQLRISAKSVVLPWDHVTVHVPRPPETSQGSRGPKINAADMPTEYVNGVNQMLKHNSESTAVVFLNLPVPPLDVNKYEGYMQCLDALTEGLPPTLMVHGLSSVISTAL